VSVATEPPPTTARVRARTTARARATTCNRDRITKETAMTD